MTYPSFASGDVLTAADMNAVGLWLVKTQTVGTAVASVTVTGAFSSTYDNYLITVSGGVGSTNSQIAVRLGASTTSYYQAGQSITYAAASVAVAVNNQSSWQSVGVCTTDSINMNFTLIGPNLAKRTYMSANYIFGNPAGGGDAAYYAGYHNVASAYTDFVVIPAAGTLTGGTIRVYGYRN